ncbi:MAG: nucleotidyltransferase domain-containing protein [Phycisphaerae bacterium]|jgi:hypothetical protein|nr:nucleotidyltransferase domain-containing protein [Phycisphaerae bacterium]
MHTDEIRSRLIESLRSALEVEPWALAAWLAGSDANGRTDRWSDIDLLVIVEDDAVERTFETCRRAIQAHGSISLELRLPMPTWHGHDQAFWQLEGVPDWCMVDLVVIRRGSTAPRFLEVERHGVAEVLFDRQGLVRPEPLDRPAHEAKVRERLHALVPRFRLLQHLVRKAVWRNDAPEAIDRYLTFTLRPLVELLRIRNVPDRFDFGLRYLRDDLPSAVWSEIEAISLPGSLDAVLRFQATAERIFEREVVLAAVQWRT